MHELEMDKIKALFQEEYGEPDYFGLTAIVFTSGDTALKVYFEEVPKDEIFKEAFILSFIERMGVKTSRVIQLRNLHGHWVLEMSLVKGRIMLIPLIESLAAGDTESARRIIQKVAQMQAQVNSIAAGDFSDYKSYAVKLIQGNPSLSATQKGKLITLAATLPDGDRLCHGDYHPANILMEDEGNCTIIDWFDAGAGDPCNDAARTFANMKHKGFFPESELNLPEIYLVAYCEASGVSRDDVLQWLPIQAGMMYGYKEELSPELEPYLP